MKAGRFTSARWRIWISPSIRTSASFWRWTEWSWFDRFVRLLLIGELLLLEVQRRRIHAIAQLRRLRTIVEDVPQMRAALAAHRFDAPHPVAVVFFGLDVVFRHRRIEARPAAAGIVFRLR